MSGATQAERKAEDNTLGTSNTWRVQRKSELKVNDWERMPVTGEWQECSFKTSLVPQLITHGHLNNALQPSQARRPLWPSNYTHRQTANQSRSELGLPTVLPNRDVTEGWEFRVGRTASPVNCAFRPRAGRALPGVRISTLGCKRVPLPSGMLGLSDPPSTHNTGHNALKFLLQCIAVDVWNQKCRVKQ